MIAKLRGRMDSRGEDWVVIDVGGVGYLVECSARTLDRLPAPGEAVEVFTRMLVSENAIRLVGFAEEAERDWFNELSEVQGVGSKVALALLSALSPAELSTAIAAGDAAMLARAKGVGPKLARRICTELKDKALTIGTGALELEAPGLAAASGAAAAASGSQAAADAVSALVNLGYTQSQAATAVGAAMQDAGENADTGELIRLALKQLSQ